MQNMMKETVSTVCLSRNYAAFAGGTESNVQDTPTKLESFIFFQHRITATGGGTLSVRFCVRKIRLQKHGLPNLAQKRRPMRDAFNW
jgi:hypothetical protein